MQLSPSNIRPLRIHNPSSTRWEFGDVWDSFFTGVHPEAPKPRKKRKPEIHTKKTKPLSCFKALISEIVIGKQVTSKKQPELHPIHLIENTDVLDHFQKLKSCSRSWLKERWSKKVIEDHCSGKETYYFAGSHESYKPCCLLMIDVDCHKSGSREGAMAYLQFLKDNHYPNLYYEVSTNGNGGHGYIIVEKDGVGAERLKSIVTQRFEPHLTALAKDFDVEFVEVKGLPPVLTWGDERFDLREYKNGELAKLPRNLKTRWRELQNTTVVKIHDLRRLPYVEPLTKKTTSSNSEIVGSVSRLHFNQEHLDGLKPGGKYHRLASMVLASCDFNITGRERVTVEDCAIFLMIGEFFNNNMNQDGTLPHARWKKMWNELYINGDIDRAWSNKRFASIRDCFSSYPLINWEDKHYFLGEMKSDGEYILGKAAKWKFSDLLMIMIAEEENVEASDFGNKENKREHPLREQKTINSTNFFTTSTFFTTTTQITPIRPTLIIKQPVYLHSPDEITKHVGYLLALAA